MADIKRLHYFNHQFLVESDFTDEQQYHLAMRRRHNAALHDYGVADGLAVTRSGDREITIQPGMAIDRDGRELVLLDSRGVNLSDTAAFPAGATVHLTIAWHEEESDPSTATGVTGNTRITEKPLVLASTTAPAGDGSVIRLARFTLTAGGNVPGNLGDVFADGRQIAGAALAPASVATDKLADGAVDESKLSVGARGKLVTHGDGHDHSGGDGAQIRHSSLSLDGGSNPHGTTAADVGALSSAGGTISGSLLLHRGTVGLGATPEPLSRLVVESNDGAAGAPAGVAFGRVATTSSDGSGTASGLEIDARGSGRGEKRGLTARVSGGGEKHAGYFSATSGTGSDFTQALHADASSEGTGVVMGLWTGLTGSGTGLKIGVVSEVRGGGQKKAASFLAESPAGSTEPTEGASISAVNQGSGLARGLSVEVGGPGGNGPKQGIVSVARGSGHKQAGEFYAESDSGTADLTVGVKVLATTEGTGDTKGLLVDASGSGAGRKDGISCQVSGAGQKDAGRFHAYSDAGSTDFTRALLAYAQNAGAGEAVACHAYAVGEGSGRKQGVLSEVSGAGDKHAGQFYASSGTSSPGFTNALRAGAGSDGTGHVMALWVNAEGSGTGLKEGIQCWASGSGEKRAAFFAAESRAGSSDYTSAVEVHAINEGNGVTKGLDVRLRGSGSGLKQGIVSIVEGGGEKSAGQFGAYSGADTAEWTNALYVRANSAGTGDVSGLRMEASGEGKGFKEGISCVTTGGGPKRAGNFYAATPPGWDDATQGLSVDAISNGTGATLGFSLDARGSGPGQKEGIVCTVSGSGHKYGGQFRAYSDSGTADGSEALRAVARSDGTGGALGLFIDAAGSGPGLKQGILANVAGEGTEVTGLDLSAANTGGGRAVGIRCATSGPGNQFAGHFEAASGASATDQTRALSAYVSSEGSGVAHALVASAGGVGTGVKYGVWAHAHGAGEKHAGTFHAGSSAGSTDNTFGVEVHANSEGTGFVSGIRGIATGEGSGFKEALSCSATGGGPKRAAYFASETATGLAETTEGVYVIARNDGTGPAHAIYAYAVGSGAGEKIGIYSSATGGGTKWAGFFVGNVHVNGVLSKAGGTFLIDHPLDPENKTLRHSFVESPEDLCLYRGKVQLDAAGKGTVKMPSYFAALTKEEDATVSLTAIGSKPFLTGCEWNRNFTAFTVYGEPGREVSYLVLADRDDPVIHQLRRPVEEKKGAGYFQKGELLNPEAYGKAPKAAPDGVGAARQTKAPMDMAPPSFPDFPAPPTPTAPPDFPLSPLPTVPFPALEEEHRQIEEAWARSREEQRQRIESFRQEEQHRRRQLEEALAAARQQPDQNAQEHGEPVEALDEAPETPSAPPESAPPRRKKTVADRKKK